MWQDVEASDDLTFQCCGNTVHVVSLQEAADTLAVQVGRKVYELAQGVGEIPSLPNTAV